MVLEPVADQTGHLCLPCFDAGLGDLRVVEVMNRGATVDIKMGNKPKVKKGPKPKRGMRQRARQVAFRRLAAVHPDLFAMFYDEECALRGLDPIIRRDRRDRTILVAETLNFDSVYAALQSSGETDA